MGLEKYIEEQKGFFSPQILQELQSRLVIHAIRHSEPKFLIKCVSGGDKPMWAVEFDDGPELWLQTFNTRQDALDFCQKQELNISYIDPDKPC